MDVHQHIYKILLVLEKIRSHCSKDKHILNVSKTKLVTGGDSSFIKYALRKMWNRLLTTLEDTRDISTLVSYTSSRQLFMKPVTD